MPITDWPMEDRPREKLLRNGPQSLTEAELIAIIIKTGIRGKTALDIAKELLAEHNSLKQLLRVPANELIKQGGLGPAKYAAIKAAIELGKRYADTTITVGEALNNSSVTQKFISNRMVHHENEVFACLFLDNHFRLLSFEELFHGTINETSIYPREIVRRSIAHNAAKIILAHNHPSGLPMPSIADKEVTQLIKQALALIDIEVVDHVIIGHRENFSFAEMGLL